jgi:hypothetical protein
MRMNVAASDQHKQYDALVPKFLHNRPKTVVQHCMRRWFDAENSTLEDVDQHLNLMISRRLHIFVLSFLIVCLGGIGRLFM